MADLDEGPPWVLEVRGPKGERIGVQSADALLRWQLALDALQAARSAPLSGEEAERARRQMDEICKGYAVEMHGARQPSAEKIAAHLLKISRRMDDLLEEINILIDKIRFPSADDHMVKLSNAYEAVDSARECMATYLNLPTYPQPSLSEEEVRCAYVLRIAEMYRDLAPGSMRVSNYKGKIGGKFMTFLFEAAQLCDNWKISTLKKDWDNVRNH